MTYDAVICGAGPSGATAARVLAARGRRVLVLETRDRVGGNCADYRSRGTLIHLHGPHIFHSTCPRIVEFLGEFTGWREMKYSVEAEVLWGGELKRVPFPYCEATAKALGRSLSEGEVIDLFFRPYSEKMWGCAWEDVPQQVRGRVTKDSGALPEYFPGQFVAMPDAGFSAMFERMLDHANIEVILSVSPDLWQTQHAKTVLHCGRLDWLSGHDEKLPHRALDVLVGPCSDWPSASPVINLCSASRAGTRVTKYSLLTGGDSDIRSLEVPRQGEWHDPAPHYPIPSKKNLELRDEMRAMVHEKYGGRVIPMGRLGTYKYLDTYQAVAQAMTLAKEL